MLEVKGLYKTYRKPGVFSSQRCLILRDVSFHMDDGECLGIIGESGSGKSTLGRLILGIEKPDQGRVFLYGKDTGKAKNRRSVMSAVFQDYSSSLNPNRTVRQSVEEPLEVLGKHCSEKNVEDLLDHVGLDGSYMCRYQHELSGGEAQRVCIARALSTSPRFILLDEAISSLDVSVQVQILDLLRQLKKEYQMGYLFITHDIQAAAYICDRIAIFRQGEIVEETETEEIGSVHDAYSKKLLDAVITL